jgi:hypothetical protein
LKLPGDDGVPQGIGPELAADIARALCDGDRVDYVSFTWGSHGRTLDWHLPDMHWLRSPFVNLTAQLRRAIPHVPVMAVGLITDPAEAEGILAQGKADLVALGRPLVTDPAWLAKAAAGREREIRYCVSCNTCWGTIVEHRPLACDNNPRVGAPDEADWRPAQATGRRRVVVLGSGVAGVEAAWVAAARGHDVTLFGVSADPGGKTRLHARLPGGESLSSVYDYQQVMAKLSGVRLELGVRATVDDVRSCEPDAVLLASGSAPGWPTSLPEIWRDDGFVPDVRTLALELLDRHQRQPGTAVLFDQDHTAGTYAMVEMLARLFERVVVATPRERIAGDVPLVTALGIHRRLARLPVELRPFQELSAESRLEDGVAALANVYTGELAFVEDVALISYSTPRVPDLGLLAPLRAIGVRGETIGDCRMPRGSGYRGRVRGSNGPLALGAEDEPARAVAVRRGGLAAQRDSRELLVAHGPPVRDARLEVTCTVEARVADDLAQVERAERGVVRLVVVVGVPIQVEGVISVGLGGRRQLHVHHQAAGAQHAVALAQDLLRGAHRLFVQEEARHHEVEAAIGEVERLRVLQRIVDLATEHLGAGVGAAQQRRTDVHAVHFGLREHVAVRQGVGTGGAPEVENAPRREPGARGPQPVRHGGRHAAAARAQLERTAEHRSAERVHRALRDVVRSELGVEATRHEMNVETAHLLRNGRRRVETQRAPGRALRRERATGLPQRRQHTLDLRLYGPPGEFLCAVAQRAPRLEVWLVEHRPAYLAGIARCVAFGSGDGRHDLRVIKAAHVPRHVDHQVLAQRSDERLAGMFVVRGR